MPPERGAAPAGARRGPRVAIIHYWLVGMRGGERVLERLLALYPEADLYTHVYVPEAVSATIRARHVRTTFIQRLPGAARRYKSYLPLMPLALEELDLSGYDLVISSESGPAKGAIAAPGAFNICYCHSPMRYLWDHYPQYRAASKPLKRLLMAPVLHGLRLWDTASAQRLDHIVVNSRFIQSRVRRAWGRTSQVIHPPVATHLFAPSRNVGDEYLWIGQMIAYKRPDLAVDAFSRLKRPLLMVGDGELLESLRRRAGPTIRFVARLDLAGLCRTYAECRALIFTAEEDFGIVPVEANAAGRPVIGFGRGGLTDSIIPGSTGLFFAEQTVDGLIDAVRAFELWHKEFCPSDAVRNAERFAPAHFDRQFLAAIASERPDLADRATPRAAAPLDRPEALPAPSSWG